MSQLIKEEKKMPSKQLLYHEEERCKKFKAKEDRKEDRRGMGGEDQ